MMSKEVKMILVAGIVVLASLIFSKTVMGASTVGALVDDTNPDITESDIELLARLITAEEGYATSYEIGTEKYNNILENYYLCGSVVINRIKSNYYPDSLEGVIYQRGQYACVSNGHINRPYDDISWEIAEELLVYGTEIPSNVLGQSQFRQMDGVYKQVGNQIYSYLGD